MHHRLFVTVNAKSREETMKLVNQWLDTQKEVYTYLDDEDDNPYTRTGFWDWYVFGGRWSQDLARAYPFGKAYWDKLEVLMAAHDIKGIYIHASQDKMEKQAIMFEQLSVWWHENVPEPFNECPHPLETDDYKEDGYISDIMPIDTAIYEYAVKPHITEQHINEWGDYHFYDIDGDAPDNKAAFVDSNKWIAVVDYHN